MNKKIVNIKIASDVVCPWCLIGKTELEIAMDKLKDEYHFNVQFLPFELAPDIPTSGVNFKEYMTNKFGNWDRFIQGSQFLMDRGKGLGINFDIENIKKSVNTFDMHRIIQFAHQFGLQSEVKNAYMRAYFEKNIDLSIQENIIAIAKENGLDEDLIRTLLNSTEGAEEIRGIQKNLRELGITGVPFFILNDQYGLSGAVPSEQLMEAIKEASLNEA